MDGRGRTLNEFLMPCNFARGRQRRFCRLATGAAGLAAARDTSTVLSLHACSVWATYLSKSCFGHKKPIEASSPFLPPPFNRTPAFSPTKITFLRPFVAPVCLTNTTVSGDIFRPPRKAFADRPADRPPSLPPLLSSPFYPHRFLRAFLPAFVCT